MNFPFPEDDPIEYACMVLEAYESEIAAKLENGIIPNGFCQGRIFKGARNAIKRKAAVAAIAGYSYTDSARNSQ